MNFDILFLDRTFCALRGSIRCIGRYEKEKHMTEADFEARVTALTEDMYRVAATLLRGHHDRQDAVQECIWKA